MDKTSEGRQGCCFRALRLNHKPGLDEHSMVNHTALQASLFILRFKIKLYLSSHQDYTLFAYLFNLHFHFKPEAVLINNSLKTTQFHTYLWSIDSNSSMHCNQHAIPSIKIQICVIPLQNGIYSVWSILL